MIMVYATNVMGWQDACFVIVTVGVCDCLIDPYNEHLGRQRSLVCTPQ